MRSTKLSLNLQTNIKKNYKIKKMIHIKRNICLMTVSCALLAGIPAQVMAECETVKEIFTKQEGYNNRCSFG